MFISKVRNVEKASVKLRFRILTEVKAEGNILNSIKYPAIKDNTMNFIVPMHIKIKHLLNGYFTVFQISLPDV